MGDEEHGKKRKLEQEPTAVKLEEGELPDQPQEKDNIRRLLSPFSREQLIEILTNAASQYDNVFHEIKAVASADVAHRKVFVRGLAWETTSERLKDAFAAFGEVEEGAVIHDKVTNKSRGYGFVTFADMEAAQRAVTRQSIEIDNRVTTCNLAAVRPQNEEHSHHHNAPSGSSRQQQPQQQQPPPPMRPAPPARPAHAAVYAAPMQNPIYPMVGMPMPPPPPPPQQQQQPPPPQPPIQSSTGGGGSADDTDSRKLFVRGLSWETSNDALRAEFVKYGELEEASVARDRKTGKSKGFGFVTFTHKASADRALQQPQKVIEGRTTTCNLACQGGNKGHGNDRNSGGMGGGPMAPVMPPAMPAYAMPMQQVGMYAAMPAPYPNAPAPGGPPPMPYAHYPGMPDPYQQPHAYAPPPQFYSNQPPPPHHLQRPPHRQ